MRYQERTVLANMPKAAKGRLDHGVDNVLRVLIGQSPS